MTKKPSPPALERTPEEALERMKALTRRVLTVPKSEAVKRKKGKHR